MANTVYPKGIKTFAKNEKAPDFVLGTAIITLNEFVSWCKGEGEEYLSEYNGQKQIRLQILNGKDGRPQLTVDTYKPTGKAQAEPESTGTSEDIGQLPF